MKNLAQIIESLILIFVGLLTVKYYATGEIIYFVYPGYIWLILISSIIISLTGVYTLYTIYQKDAAPCCSHDHSCCHNHKDQAYHGHTVNILKYTLLLPLIVGYLVTPRPLSAETALNRGLTLELDLEIKQESVLNIFTTNPENRNVLEWVRTLTFNPEPEAHLGLPVNLSGFILDLDDEDFIYIARFLVACCAADARPIALPILRNELSKDLSNGDWIQLEGTFTTFQRPDIGRKAVVNPDQINLIEQPRDPYVYQ